LNDEDYVFASQTHNESVEKPKFYQNHFFFGISNVTEKTITNKYNVLKNWNN